MRNPLYEELVELDYVPIRKLDEELPPEFVLLHLKNLSQENQRFIIESIDTSIPYLAHQNPSLEQYQDQENAVQFCLTLVPYTPTVIIDDIAEIVKPEYPYRFTITGSISTTETDIPNSVTVLYGDTIAQANFINDTNKWTLTIDLDEVTSTTLQSLSAVGTVFNIESGKISPESDRVYSEFLIRFPIELYLLPVEDVQITVEEIYNLLPVENVKLSFVEVLSLNPVENVNLTIESFLGLIPVQKVKLNVIEDLTLFPVENITLTLID